VGKDIRTERAPQMPTVEFEGGLQVWVAGLPDLERQRQRTALNRAIQEAERQLEEAQHRLAVLRTKFDALDEPPLAERLYCILAGATGKLPAADVWKVLGKSNPWQRTQRDNQELGAAMRALGWCRTMQRFGGGKLPRSAYVRGTTEQRRRPLHLVRCPITAEWLLLP
jgi:hypothetical protein